MAIILFKKGSGQPQKMNEFGFEHLLASGEWFLMREEALATNIVTTDAEMTTIIEAEEKQPEREEIPIKLVSLDKMSVPQLKETAKELNIKGYHNMKKETLIERINDTQD